MYTTNELLEVLDEAEMAYISADFWFSRENPSFPVSIHDHPEHPVWKELNAFQNGWLACKNFYKINT
jgi:hypothetical protein